MSSVATQKRNSRRGQAQPVKSTMQRAKDGNERRWDLGNLGVITAAQAVQAYAPLASGIAWRKSRIKQNVGISKEDLVQEVHLRMVQDIFDKFDPSRGVKFETFMSRQIEGAITSEISRAFTQNGSVYANISRVRVAQSALDARRGIRGRELLTDSAKKMLIGMQKGELSEEEVMRRIEKMKQGLFRADHVFLSSPERADENGKERLYSDTLADRSVQMPDERRDVTRMRMAVDGTMAVLNGRELEAVRRRYFGLGWGREGKQPPLAEIGRAMGISRERVRQVLEAAHKKMGDRLSQNLKIQEFLGKGASELLEGMNRPRREYCKNGKGRKRHASQGVQEKKEAVRAMGASEKTVRSVQWNEVPGWKIPWAEIAIELGVEGRLNAGMFKAAETRRQFRSMCRKLRQARSSA